MTPRSSLPVLFVIDVKAQCVHSQPQLGAFLVLDVEVVDPIHLQILGYLQVLHHGVFSAVQGGNLIDHKTHQRKCSNLL